MSLSRIHDVSHTQDPLPAALRLRYVNVDQAPARSCDLDCVTLVAQLTRSSAHETRRANTYFTEVAALE